MVRVWYRVCPFILVVTLAHCAAAQTDEESLRDSFSEQIATSSFVTDFARDGDELTFSGPDADGLPAEWRVLITSALVESNLFDEAIPYQGRITSEWHVNGQLVEYVGSVTALASAYLDRGVGQECWANWAEAEHRWLVANYLAEVRRAGRSR